MEKKREMTELEKKWAEEDRQMIFYLIIFILLLIVIGVWNYLIKDDISYIRDCSNSAHEYSVVEDVQILENLTSQSSCSKNIQVLKQDNNINKIKTKSGDIVTLSDAEFQKYIENNQVVVQICEPRLYVRLPLEDDNKEEIKDSDLPYWYEEEDDRLAGHLYKVKELEIIKVYPWDGYSLDNIKEEIEKESLQLVDGLKFDEFEEDYILTRVEFLEYVKDKETF